MLPILLPDMTLYSLNACAHRMSGWSRGAQMSLSLYGDPNAGLLHDFPSNLHEFCRRTDGAYGEPGDIARTATVLPYFVRFRPATLEAEAVDVMCSPTVQRLKFLLGLPASPTAASFPLRACAHCIVDDEKEFGLAYWHRSHQLPGVYFCQKHDERLRQSSLRVDRRRRSVFLLPRDHGIFPKEHQSAIPASVNTILFRLAKLSADVLDRPLPREYSPFHLRETYFHGLRDRGLLTRGGCVRAQEFLKGIRDAYQALAHYPPYDWILSKQHLDGLLRLVRKPRSDFHTVYHVLLIDSLFQSWDNFTQVYAWENVMNPIFEERDSSASQNTSIAAPDPCLLSLAQRVEFEGRSLTSLCREMCIDFQTATRQLVGIGAIRIKRRPKVLTAELRSTIVGELRNGEAQRTVASRHHLSRATIDRICQETPNLHDEWSRANLERKRHQERGRLAKFLERHPNATRDMARQNCDSGYSWLRRHDTQWLSSQIPKATAKRIASAKLGLRRVDWMARDLECLAALQKLAPRIEFEQGERFKPGVVLRKLPRLRFVPRLDRLPRSRNFVMEILAQHKPHRP